MSDSSQRYIQVHVQLWQMEVLVSALRCALMMETAPPVRNVAAMDADMHVFLLSFVRPLFIPFMFLVELNDSFEVIVLHSLKQVKKND